MTDIIPKRIFIVPYRNRIQHKFFFSKYMEFLLENDNDYEIYFSHQCDTRPFNRGAVKNIGFMAVRNKYPEHYKDMNFIFNDLDTLPFNKIFDYSTEAGTVKHYYGFKYALGGIVVIKGGDFENTNGYPCLWGWGMEDNALQVRCLKQKLKIDRTQFYDIGSPQILQLFDGVERLITKNDKALNVNACNNVDGIKTIQYLQYDIDSKSSNISDNMFTIHNSKHYYININSFTTFLSHENESYYKHDLRDRNKGFFQPLQKDKINLNNTNINKINTPNNWKKINPKSLQNNILSKQNVLKSKKLINTYTNNAKNMTLHVNNLNTIFRHKR